MIIRSAARIGLLAALFVIGFALMGFEMLGSRYLNPYFGSGITTWACLISVVLFAMMLGYFAGGYAVDAYPGVGLLAACVAAAAACLLLVPPTADAVLQAILQTIGDGFAGVLTASLALSLLPVAFLSACSPFVVRLLLVDLDSGGKTAGIVYSVSTLGNVAGTLATTYLLIPSLGVRTITSAFGAVLAALAVIVWLSRNRLGKGIRTAARRAAAAIAVTVTVAAVASAWPALRLDADDARRQTPHETRHETWGASYPEGPLWLGDRLIYAEMGADKVVGWQAGQRRDLWHEPGCGPTAVSAYRGGDLIVLCHIARKLVHLDAAGRKVGELAAASDGEPFQDPNDGHSDGQGGVFFSDPGLFLQGAPATGKVFHLRADGRIVKVLDGLAYSNGIAVDFAGRRLLVAEHLARKVWQLALAADLSIGERRLLLDVSRYLTPEEMAYAETGPDGIEVDRESGTVFVPVYGAGRLLAVAPDGTVSKIPVPMQFVTNVAISGERAVVLGPYVNDTPPFPGRVELMPRSLLMEAVRRGVVQGR